MRRSSMPSTHPTPRSPVRRQFHRPSHLRFPTRPPVPRRNDLSRLRPSLVPVAAFIVASVGLVEGPTWPRVGISLLFGAIDQTRGKHQSMEPRPGLADLALAGAGGIDH